ncbi:hypothetical protein Ana3638_14915 [Anaerocolumna sedimenticola]|uniref:Peptidase M56 domain-containing protein n=1 Tax=Anaerocolumna sedimenticola TaxID=2696063 RepID=A0A6P1TQU8_9FIRM|nr:M56 family metallopeptidase [Anaerocolumna sedimenticola]QHQ61915.1 hypothetical protein Ana3638_14915 [Anaerocolumna sedimenticola]
MLTEIFRNLINVSITTSILIGILILLLPLLRKNYTAKWRYWVWLVIAVRLLIPLNLPIPKPPIEISVPSQNVDIKIPLLKPVTTPAPHYFTAPPAVKERNIEKSISITEILVTVWLLGIVLFILYYIGGYIVFRNSVKRLIRPVKDNRVLDLFSGIKKELKVTKNVRLYSCKKGISPMMTGFFNPVMILPDYELENDSLGLILKHELIHYKRKDIWYKGLVLLANGIHWFNPLVYLMKNQSEKDLEMVCDSEVIKDRDIAFKRKYSETILLAVHQGNIHNTAFSTYIHGGKKTMKKRFTNIFDKGKKKPGIAALCLILAAVCLIGGLVAWERKDNIPKDYNNTVDTSDNSDNGAKKDNQIVYGDNGFGASDQVENSGLPETSDSINETDSTDSEDDTVPLTVTDNAGYKGSHNTDVDNAGIVGTDNADTNTTKTDTDATETSGNELNSDDNSSGSDTRDENIFGKGVLLFMKIINTALSLLCPPAGKVIRFLQINGKESILMKPRKLWKPVLLSPSDIPCGLQKKHVRIFRLWYLL